MLNERKLDEFGFPFVFILKGKATPPLRVQFVIALPFTNCEGSLILCLPGEVVSLTLLLLRVPNLEIVNLFRFELDLCLWLSNNATCRFTA